MTNEEFMMSRGADEENRNEDFKLLRKLRFWLFFWLISLVLAIIWFTSSPSF